MPRVTVKCLFKQRDGAEDDMKVIFYEHCNTKTSPLY